MTSREMSAPFSLRDDQGPLERLHDEAHGLAVFQKLGQQGLGFGQFAFACRSGRGGEAVALETPFLPQPGAPFADRFEAEFIGQGLINRSAEDTLTLAWDLLAALPAEALKRIPQRFIEQYHAARDTRPRGRAIFHLASP